MECLKVKKKKGALSFRFVGFWTSTHGGACFYCGGMHGYKVEARKKRDPERAKGREGEEGGGEQRKLETAGGSFVVHKVRKMLQEKGI